MNVLPLDCVFRTMTIMFIIFESLVEILFIAIVTERLDSLSIYRLLHSGIY